MTRELTVTIPGRPPTPNIRGNANVQWARTKKWRTAAAAVGSQVKPEGWEPIQRCRMAIEFVVPTRIDRDWDNLIASTKPLTDGLVDAGLLVKDSNAVIADVTFSWRYERGIAATIYRITELPTDQLAVAL